MILNGQRPKFHLPLVGRGALLIVKIAARVEGKNCVSDKLKKRSQLSCVKFEAIPVE